jgi:phosphatidylglycerol:prolipoprotein diacylglycerol transferase
MDLSALTIPLPWAVSKLGCLLNGCCYGRPSSLPWAISFPEGSAADPAGVPLHPTQVYEILLMIGLWILFRRLRQDRWQGTWILWFVGVYGLGRATLDFFRGDEGRSAEIGPLTVTQMICILAGALACVLLRFWPPGPSAAVPRRESGL